MAQPLAQQLQGVEPSFPPLALILSSPEARLAKTSNPSITARFPVPVGRHAIASIAKTDRALTGAACVKL
jgi:hypothetical protein